MLVFSSLTLLTLAFGLHFVGLVNALKGDSNCGRYLCVNATVHHDTVTYQLTARRQPVGWLAIGFGRHMVDTHMVVLWRNNDDSITLSQRYATGHTEPKVVEDPPRIATLPEMQPANWLGTPNASLSFNIPLNKTLFQSEDATERLIWAYSMTTPHSAEPDAEIYQHYTAGYLRLNLAKDLPGTLPEEELENEGQPSEAPDDSSKSSDSGSHADDSDSSSYTKHDKMLLAHGILVTTGFLFLLPLGSLVARWGRTFTSKWFKAHRAINFYISLPVIALGWILGPLSVLDAKASHFLDGHQICGLLLFVVYLLQVFLGRYIHARKARLAELNKPTRPHPPSNVLHVVLGLLTITFAFFQVRSGMDEWELTTGHDVAHWCHNLWKAWAFVLPITYLVGLTLLKRQFHQETSGLSPSSTPRHYLALSPEDGAPSALFDSEQDYGESNMAESRVSKEFESEIPLLKRH